MEFQFSFHEGRGHLHLIAHRLDYFCGSVHFSGDILFCCYFQIVYNNMCVWLCRIIQNIQFKPQNRTEFCIYYGARGNYFQCKSISGVIQLLAGLVVVSVPTTNNKNAKNLLIGKFKVHSSAAFWVPNNEIQRFRLQDFVNWCFWWFVRSNMQTSLFYWSSIWLR